MTGKERWSDASVAVHWLAAALIVGLATAGFVMTGLPADSSGRQLLSRLHTLGGATLMLLHVGGVLLQQPRKGVVLRSMVPFLGVESPAYEKGAW